jgi:hypothetical protein
MANEMKNRIRALILLMVFSLNTIIGFACSVGVSMGYNEKHHEHYQHHKHEKGHDHHHSHKSIHESVPSGSIIKAPVNDCCSGQVTSFAKLDKWVSYNNLLIKAPVLFIQVYNNFLNLESRQTYSSLNSNFQFVRRSCFLNDINIRIAIRSFQI